MSSGFDDLHELALDLSEAPKEAIPNIRTAVKVSALVGKKAWQADAARHRMTPGYAPSIDFDSVESTRAAIHTELGPNLSRGVGVPGFGILEDSPGDVNGTPRRSYVSAEKVIEEDLERGVQIAIDQALKRSGL